MTAARSRALAGIVAAILIGAAITAAVIGRAHSHLTSRPEARRPALLLLTSLPLVFSEQFTLSGQGSPAYTALAERYKVVPISIAEPEELDRGTLLFMAQPRAQPPENLVALDDWVRHGGRVLLLADPLLEWPSSRPLGDPLGPSPMFMDTGLLAHWGLRLDAPDERGRSQRNLAGEQILTQSPGTLVSSRCSVSSEGFVAECRIGKGRAIVVADADFLDAPNLGSSGAHNLEALLRALDELEHP
jgi:hypothetical protein